MTCVMQKISNLLQKKNKICQTGFLLKKKKRIYENNIQRSFEINYLRHPKNEKFFKNFLNQLLHYFRPMTGQPIKYLDISN